jgi:hypothetical protein
VDLAKTRFTNINNQTAPRKPNNDFVMRPGLLPLNHNLVPNLNPTPLCPSISSFRN